ncbi:MAG: hypothetical protein HRU14_07380 [Planctomycetes bacterium]|nr:hypothetical protein [Planctomycetota bacterium]
MRFLFPIVVLGMVTVASAQDASRDGLARFIATHRKTPGTYGPVDQPWADATWTWRALRCADLVGEEPGKLHGNVRTAIRALPTGASWSRRATHARLLRLVGIDPSPPPRDPPFLSATSWVGSPPLSELEALVEMQRLGGVEPDRPVLEQVLSLWRARDGGWRWPATLKETFAHVREGTDFEQLPETPEAPSTAGSIAAAVRCHVHGGIEIRDAHRAALRLHALRRINGGYRQGTPGYDVTGLWATYDALRALRDLGTKPVDSALTASWIAGHRHRSGGFAHAPEEPPSLEATWLALECLHLLGQPLPPMPAHPLEGGWPDADDPGDLQLFQAAVQMGSDPGTCVALAHRIGADLLLIKTLQNTERELARRAHAVAKGFARPLAIGCAREEHRRAWGVEGLGYATHCSDVVFDIDHELADRAWHVGFEALVDAWREDRSSGALVFSASHLHRELLAPAYEHSARRGGYGALMAGWAFAPGGDVVRENPWLERWVARLPVLGNHDAHTDPFHWLHQGLRTRTLFFARSPDVAAFVDAVRKGRVVAVAHGDDGLTAWGHPHWTARARRQRKVWDRGRPANLLPAPIAIPIDRRTHGEMPALREGFGIIVRAAARLGDDALPSEVAVHIDGQSTRLPLRLAPPQHDGPPVLWLPLPHLERGEHEVRITANERTTTQRLIFADPVRADEPHPSTNRTRPPQKLELGSPDELPFVRHTSLTPTDFQGSVKITCGRADVIIGSGEGGHIRVDITGGHALDWLRLHVDGNDKPFSLTSLDGNERTILLPIPKETAARTIHRITIRTSLDGWIQRPSASDLELRSVSWEVR